MVERVVREYRERDLPLDVIYLDIHYMNSYRVFTFDPNRFPDPKALTDKLSKQGVKTVAIVDPGVKYQPPLPAPSPQIPEPVMELTIEQATVSKLGESARALLPQDRSYYVFDQGFAGNHFQRRKNGDLCIPR